MLDQLKQQLQSSIDSGTFVKLSISKPRQKSSDLKNVYVRLIQLKGQTNLSFTLRYQTKDQVKNFGIDYAWEQISFLLNESFRNATLLTTQADYQVQISKKEKVLFSKHKPSITEVPKEDHDRQKEKRSGNADYLFHLGVTDQKGNVIPKMADKYRQINKYLEIIESLIEKADLPETIHVVDMGSGKGYLTFALYEFLKNNLGLNVEVTGIELRNELVDFCNEVADKCKYDGLNFVAQRIENYTDKQIDILIALHACDTATDDAIKKGIDSDASLIICAPCCHKQIRQQVKGKQKHDPILKHGIFEERQMEMVTDAIRALIMEKNQYDSKAFQFISSEHTAKNVMLVGTKTSKDKDLNEINDSIQQLKDRYLIDEHYLEKIVTSS